MSFVCTSANTTAKYEMRSTRGVGCVDQDAVCVYETTTMGMRPMIDVDVDDDDDDDDARTGRRSVL